MPTVPELEPVWLDVVDAVARSLFGPRDDRRLVDEVRALSSIYTRNRGAIREASRPSRARLEFFLPRDLPKIEPAVATLAARGLLPSREVWTVVDLGAGYGSSSLGLGRALARLGVAKRLKVRAIDDDARALEAFAAIAKETRSGALEGVCVPIDLEPVLGTVALADPSRLVRDADLALVGFVLNELFFDDARAEEASRVDRLASWCARLVEGLLPGGIAIVLEPALRETSRILMHVRDATVHAGLDVVLPCTHRNPCPLLSRERDWCHAELPIALPGPLASIARDAGLRFEGLSYASLALRRAALAPAVAARRSSVPRASIVGGPISTKGKVELHLCHEAGLTRLDWLARDGRPPRSLHRGAVVTLDRVLGAERARQGRDVIVREADVLAEGETSMHR